MAFVKEYQTEAQRSGFGLERRSSEMSELSALAGSEGYGIRDDEVGDVKVPSDYGMTTFSHTDAG